MGVESPWRGAAIDPAMGLPSVWHAVCAGSLRSGGADRIFVRTSGESGTARTKKTPTERRRVVAEGKKKGKGAAKAKRDLPKKVASSSAKQVKGGALSKLAGKW